MPAIPPPVEDNQKKALPPVDPLQNLIELFSQIVAKLLVYFPQFVAIIVFIFLFILALLFGIFPTN